MTGSAASPARSKPRSKGAPDGLLARLGRLSGLHRLNGMIRDRQILLRSEEGTRTLHLSRRSQIVALTLSTALVAWTVGATTGLIDRQGRLSDQRGQIAQMEVNYADLIADLAMRHGSLAAVGDRLIQHESLAQTLLARNQEALAEIADLSAALTRTEATRETLATSRALLEVETVAARQRLDRLTEERRVIEGELADLTSAVRDRDAAARSLEDELVVLQQALTLRHEALASADRFAAALQTQVTELDRALRTVFTAVDRLMLERDGLQGTAERQQDLLTQTSGRLAEAQTLLRQAWLTTAEIGLERDRLLTEQGQLLAEIDRANRRDREAEALVADLEQRLSRAYVRAAGLHMERDRLLDDRGGLVATAERLERQITRMRDSQEQILAELRGRADEHLGEIQQGLAFTGLDIDDLIVRLRDEVGRDTGGPLVPVLSADLFEDSGWDQAMTVISLMGRAAELRDVVERLPVTVPLRDEYRISSTFGRRADPFTGRAARHLGIDFAAPRRTDVLAAAPGRVVHAGRQGAYGNLVEIDHGLGVRTRYAHLHSVNVRVNEMVARDQRIGLLGCTGRCTGPHLHYEVLVNGQQRDPANFLRAGRHVLESQQQVDQR